MFCKQALNSAPLNFINQKLQVSSLLSDVFSLSVLPGDDMVVSGGGVLSWPAEGGEENLFAE